MTIYFTPFGGDANGKSYQLKLTRRLAINLSEFTLKCRGQIYIRNQDGVANVSVVIRKKVAELIESRAVTLGITVLILINAVTLGIEKLVMH